jgi:uncharacterized iron-regulated membrane protein
MYEQPETSVVVVVALYAIAAILAVIFGVVTWRARRRRRNRDRYRNSKL